MSFSAAAVRRAIRDVLEGASGTLRTVEADVMTSGVFAGQHPAAQKAKALLADHRFDVRIANLRRHEASPVAAIGSYRLALADIFVEVTTKTATVVQLTERDETLAAIASDMDDAIQAIAFPGNAAQTAALEATGIVSGMLTGPGGEGVPEWSEVSQDWDAQMIRSRISATATLRIRQSVVTDDEPVTIFGTAAVGWWRADVAHESSSWATHWPDISEQSGPTLEPATLGQSLVVDPTGVLDFQSLQSLGPSFPAYRMLASGDFLTAAQAPNVFVVGRFTAVDTGSISTIFRATYQGNTNVISCIKTAIDRVAVQVGVTTVSTATTANTSAHLFQFLHDGTSARVRVDDVAETVGTAALAGVEATDISIPSDGTDPGPFEYLEVLFLSSYPTADQRTAYRQYVVDRYGLSITP